MNIDSLTSVTSDITTDTFRCSTPTDTKNLVYYFTNFCNTMDPTMNNNGSFPERNRDEDMPPNENNEDREETVEEMYIRRYGEELDKNVILTDKLNAEKAKTLALSKRVGYKVPGKGKGAKITGSKTLIPTINGVRIDDLERINANTLVSEARVKGVIVGPDEFRILRKVDAEGLSLRKRIVIKMFPKYSDSLDKKHVAKKRKTSLKSGKSSMSSSLMLKDPPLSPKKSARKPTLFITEPSDFNKSKKSVSQDLEKFKHPVKQVQQPNKKRKASDTPESLVVKEMLNDSDNHSGSALDNISRSLGNEPQESQSEEESEEEEEKEEKEENVCPDSPEYVADPVDEDL